MNDFPFETRTLKKKKPSHLIRVVHVSPSSLGLDSGINPLSGAPSLRTPDDSSSLITANLELLSLRGDRKGGGASRAGCIHHIHAWKIS